jgi:FtsZ-binding cell division protein ZapB
MKGLFGGKKNEAKTTEGMQANVAPQDMQALQLKMTEMMEQNQILMKEVQELKVQNENPMPVMQNMEHEQTNVVNINKSNCETKKPKEVI